MRRRVEQHVPVGRGRPAAQARAGWAARRRVHRAAAPAGARAGRRRRCGRATTLEALSALAEGRLRRPRGRADPRRGLPAAADCSSTGSSSTACVARTSCPTSETDLRRLGRAIGHAATPPRRSSSRVRRGPARSAGSTSGSSTGRCSNAAAKLTSATSTSLTPEAARARLAALGFRDPAGAMRHLESLTSGVTPAGRDPADPAAGDARLVRRRSRPRRRAARLPPGQRRARHHALVPQDAPRRGLARPSGSLAPWRAAGMPPTSSCGRRSRSRCWGARRADAAHPGGARRDHAAAAGDGANADAAMAAVRSSAGTSCCGSPSPTCPTASTSPGSARR